MQTKLRFHLVRLAVVALVIALALPALVALAVPPLPSGFYGTVKIDGANVPNGTVVSAWINGVKYVETTTFMDSGNSVYFFEVPGDDPETPGVIEGGVTGNTVIFRVNGQTADQTALWQSGTNVERNLTVTSPSGVSVALPGDANGVINSQVSIPVQLPNSVTSSGILSYQFTLAFTSSVLQFTGVTKTGSLSAAWTVDSNETVPGTVTVAGYHTQPLSGSGVLLYLNFTVGNTGGAQTALQFTQFKFNEGLPAAQTTNGQFTALALGISGKVEYFANTAPVSGVSLSLTGQSSGSTSSNTAGQFSIDASAVGNYTLTPAKQNDHRSAISALDSAWILEATLSKRTLTSNQQIAADVSEVDGVTAYDAALIARYLAGLTDPPSVAGQWRFTPASRSYTSLSSSMTDQNFSALLYGDVTGNWVVEGTGLAAAGPTAPASLHLSRAVGRPNEKVTIVASVEGVVGQTIQALQFDLRYDPSLVIPQQVFQSSSLGSEWTIVYNERESGRITIVAYTAEALVRDSPLLDLTFLITEQTGQFVPLSAESIRFNEYPLIEKDADNGGIQITSSYRIYLPATIR